MIDTLLRVVRILGGKGSGNFGHAGRPGKVGGSGPGGMPIPEDDPIQPAEPLRVPKSGWDQLTVEERRAVSKFELTKEFRSFGKSEFRGLKLTAPGGVDIMVNTRLVSIEKMEEAIADATRGPEYPNGIENPRALIEDFALMASGVSRTGELTVKAHNRADGTTSVEFTFKAHDVRMTRLIASDEDGVTVHHEWFELGERLQENGVGARMLVDSLDIYAKHDFSHVTTTANIDVGGYAWARLGFKSAEPASFRDTVEARVYNDNLSIPDERRTEIMKEVRGRETFAPEWLAAQPEGKQILLGTNWHAKINLGISGPNLRSKLREKIAKKKVRK